MADVSVLEQTGVKIGKEVPQESLMMRWGDGGDPATIYLKGDEKYIRDERTGMGRYKNEDISFTPAFTEELLPGSIVKFGEGQAFEVVSPSHDSLRKTYPGSVFVRRIPLEDRVDEKGRKIESYNTLAEKLKSEGKYDMIFSKDSDNIPLSDKTKNQLRSAA